MSESIHGAEKKIVATYPRRSLRTRALSPFARTSLRLPYSSATAKQTAHTRFQTPC